MGVFDDKKFEELDWLSQATEPIDSKLNEVLGSIPDEINIDFETYRNIIKQSYNSSASIENALDYYLQIYCPDYILSWDQKSSIKNLFKFEFVGERIILDFEQNQLIGEIKFIKLASTMDEKVLESLLGKEGINAVATMYFASKDALSRANEVMEILGKCEDGLRSRSEKRKRYSIRTRLVSLFKTNEWKIKDTELANKVGFWIKSYICDGNIASFSNFCRLKVMTHKDQPIYSMEEVK